MYSAESSLGRAVIAAHTTGLRALSRSTIRSRRLSNTTPCPTRSWRRSLPCGERPISTKRQSMAIHPAGPGGRLGSQRCGIAASGCPPLRCSHPLADVTSSGDTETTLHDADPNQLYENTASLPRPRSPIRETRAPPMLRPFTAISRRISAHADSGRIEGDFAQRLRAVLSGARCGWRSGQLRSLRGHDPQFQDRIPGRAGSVLARQKMRAFIRSALKCL